MSNRDFSRLEYKELISSPSNSSTDSQSTLQEGGYVSELRHQYEGIIAVFSFPAIQRMYVKLSADTSAQKAQQLQRYTRERVNAFKQLLNLTYFDANYSTIDAILLKQLDGLYGILEKRFLLHPDKLQQIFNLLSPQEIKTSYIVTENENKNDEINPLLLPSSLTSHQDLSQDVDDFKIILKLIQRTLRGESIGVISTSLSGDIAADVGSLNDKVQKKYRVHCEKLKNALLNITQEYLKFFRYYRYPTQNLPWNLCFHYLLNGHLIQGPYNQERYQPLISLIHTIAQTPQGEADIQQLFKLLFKKGQKTNLFFYDDQLDFFLEVEKIYLRYKTQIEQNNHLTSKKTQEEWLKRFAEQINQLKRNWGLSSETPIESDLVSPEEQWQRTKDNIRIKIAAFLVWSMAIAEAIVAYYACQHALELLWGVDYHQYWVLGLWALVGGAAANYGQVAFDVPDVLASFFSTLHKDKNGETVNIFKLLLMGFFIIFSFTTGALCYGSLAKESCDHVFPAAGNLWWALAGPNGICIGLLFYYNCVDFVNRTEFSEVPGEFFQKLRKLGIAKGSAYILLTFFNLMIDAVILFTAIGVFGCNLGYLGWLAQPTAFCNSIIMAIFAFRKIQKLINRISWFNTDEEKQNQQNVTQPLDRLQDGAKTLFKIILLIALIGNTGLGQMFLFIVSGAPGLGKIGITDLVGDLGDQIITGFSQIINSAFPILVGSLVTFEDRRKPSPGLLSTKSTEYLPKQEEEKKGLRKENRIRFFRYDQSNSTHLPSRDSIAERSGPNVGGIFA